jgi:hypothetical protein
MSDTANPGSTGDLSPWQHNPRKVSPDALGRLRKQLAAFGDLGGIVFNVRTGRLVGGHQRVSSLDGSWPIDKQEAPDALGTVAVGWIDTPHGRFSYREVDWPAEKEALANLAANNPTGTFDPDLLEPLLTELHALPEIDLDLSGFSEQSLAKLLSPETEEPEVKEWELGTVYEPFWIVLRGPVELFGRVKALLDTLDDERILVETSL